jgi:hypothetical protein
LKPSANDRELYSRQSRLLFRMPSPSGGCWVLRCALCTRSISTTNLVNFFSWSSCISYFRSHERTTTAKNMGILKYHLISLISYERGWPLACLDGLIKPKQASHQGARWTSSVSMLRVPILALIIETSAVWPWCRRSFQDICRGLDNHRWAYLWLISHDLSHGVPLMFSLLYYVPIPLTSVCLKWLISWCWVTFLQMTKTMQDRVKKHIARKNWLALNGLGNVICTQLFDSRKWRISRVAY